MPVSLWIAFAVIVVVLLALDLAVFHRKAHQVAMREAVGWSVVWVVVALLFSGAVWWLKGRDPAMQYLTGYIVEKSLSVDNLFVFLVLFKYFGVRPQYQHRVLAWGVIGAIVLRTIMIGAGAALVARFHWLLYVFGAFLVFTGVKLAVTKEDVVDPTKNLAVRIARRVVPMTAAFHGQRFFVRSDGRSQATPMLLVLVTVELSDVMFAVDSIPAIFGITQDFFILLTSNIFAILGLRALYFVLAGLLDRLTYLQLGLSAVLTFIGLKMLAASWIHVSTAVSLGVVAGILTIAVVASWLRPPAQDDEKPAPPSGDPNRAD
ncbi:MAG: TerC family protein [Deltaproteobacteria bacterium]|nr:TerC family protein [Deltaproteobacteria bacterium]MBW2537928.1 TerC family protein [Deltaproteobacteria bacterium]